MLEIVEQSKSRLSESEESLKKIESALPEISDMVTMDSEIDELSELAKQQAVDLLDLGMNVDPRFSGPILQTASSLMGHAISAKATKIDKKLKMVQLQLQKAKLEYQIEKDNKKVAATSKSDASPGTSVVDGVAVEIDRNTLLRELLENQKKMNASESESGDSTKKA